MIEFLLPTNRCTMREPREPRSIIEAAEQAAAAGKYAAAEEFLREAALVQEARLGPLHPDLANTLNNLGVVCEITGNPVDAEHCFRRALTIATTVMEPDHPFVATSRKNLRDFCEAHGKPFELPVDPSRESHAHTAPREPREPLSDGRVFRRFAMGVLGPIAMLMVILAVGLPRLSSSELAGPSPAIAESPHTFAPPRAPVAVEPIAVATETANTGPTLVRAQLCADLDDWHCDPPDLPIPPGPLFFYTQVRSASGTTVQHRWYHDNRLQHSVELNVQASPSVGYRSYSRYTMNDESVGNWKIELRTEDGVLLHEEHFSVR